MATTTKTAPTTTTLKYKVQFHFSTRCNPRAYLLFHYGRRVQRDDRDVVYAPLTATEVVLSGPPGRLTVSLCALDRQGQSIGEKRIDQCFPTGGQQWTLSRLGKFSIQVEAELQSVGDVSLLEKRAVQSAQSFLNMKHRWSIDYLRACNLCNLVETEGRMPSEYYWYYQGQHARALSVKLFLQHLDISLFHLGLKFPLTLASKIELLKELLTVPAHQMVYLSDLVDGCGGVTGPGETKSESLPNESADLDDPSHYFQGVPCHNQELEDIPNNPFEVRDHSLLCGDCEDCSTVTMNQSQQFVAADMTAATPHKNVQLLRQLQKLASHYYFFAASVLVFQNGRTVSDDEFGSGRSSQTGRYSWREDKSKYGNAFTSHTTVIAISKHDVLQRLSGGSGGSGDHRHPHHPPFLLESTEWMPAMQSQREPVKPNKLHEELSTFQYSELFRWMKSPEECHDWNWYFSISSLVSEQVRREYGKGEFIPVRNGLRGIPFRSLFEGDYHLIPTISSSPEDDQKFASACFEVYEFEGCTFLPREATYNEVKRGSPGRVGVLYTGKAVWGRATIRESFKKFMADKYRFTTSEQVVCDGVVQVAIELFPLH